ncbi:MAG: tyrosine-protein phosphatase [Clostridiales bacterium]|nr:tyrosine-protein phosphatase [Clostridiales bacterium]
MDLVRDSSRLLIPGLYNARDLGNMPAADGRMTACHHLVRSDAPDHLNAESIRELSAYPIGAVIDLRSKEEAAAHPDSIREDHRFTYYNIPLLHINADDINANIISETIRTSLGQLYVWMFENCKPYFAEVLRTILKEKGKTVLFHCAHGKDRTGLITAIFYLLCGVSRDLIISDYAISYTYVADLVAPLMEATEESVHHIYRSDASNMEMLLAHVDKNYQGDIRVFLRSCGLTDEEMSALRGILLPD